MEDKHYNDALDAYLKDGVDLSVTPLRGTAHEDLEQLVADSFHAGTLYALKRLGIYNGYGAVTWPAASQPPAVKGAERWVDVSDRQPAKKGTYKVQRLHSEGHVEQAEYFPIVGWANHNGYPVIKWLDEADESTTAAGDGKEAIEFKKWTMTEECRYFWLREDEFVNMDNPKQKVTTAELYNIFKQQNK